MEENLLTGPKDQKRSAEQEAFRINDSRVGQLSVPHMRPLMALVELWRSQGLESYGGNWVMTV